MEPTNQANQSSQSRQSSQLVKSASHASIPYSLRACFILVFLQLYSLASCFAHWPLTCQCRKGCVKRAAIRCEPLSLRRTVNTPPAGKRNLFTTARLLALIANRVPSQMTAEFTHNSHTWRDAHCDKMPRRLKRANTPCCTRATEQRLIFVVNDLLFPAFVSLIEMCTLLLLSKRFKRLLDFQKTVMQHVCCKLNIPKVIKLSTVLKQKGLNSIHYGLTMEENRRITESCMHCLVSPHLIPGVRLEYNRCIRVGRNVLTCVLCTNCIKSSKLRVRPQKNERVYFKNRSGGRQNGVLIGLDNCTAIVKLPASDYGDICLVPMDSVRVA